MDIRKSVRAQYLKFLDREPDLDDLIINLVKSLYVTKLCNIFVIIVHIALILEII